MSTILELPEVRARVRRMSVALYHQLTELGALPKRTELIRGVLIDKMSKSPLHSTISKRLYHRCFNAIPLGYCVRRDDPLAFADSEPEPDVAVVRGVDEDFLNRHPTSAELVIEIAVTSLGLDRAMADLYAEAGVKEYWIVNAKQQQVEIYRRPEGGKYAEQRVAARDEVLACESVPAIRIPLADIFG